MDTIPKQGMRISEISGYHFDMGSKKKQINLLAIRCLNSFIDVHEIHEKLYLNF
mgnify:CR=1 FL=1